MLVLAIIIYYYCGSKSLVRNALWKEVGMAYPIKKGI